MLEESLKLANTLRWVWRQTHRLDDFGFSQPGILTVTEHIRSEIEKVVDIPQEDKE